MRQVPAPLLDRRHADHVLRDLQRLQSEGFSLGLGGHDSRIRFALSPGSRLVGLDLDTLQIPRGFQGRLLGYLLFLDGLVEGRAELEVLDEHRVDADGTVGELIFCLKSCVISPVTCSRFLISSSAV